MAMGGSFLCDVLFNVGTVWSSLITKCMKCQKYYDWIDNYITCYWPVLADFVMYYGDKGVGQLSGFDSFTDRLRSLVIIRSSKFWIIRAENLLSY